jgi:hypothetical protein
LLTRVQVQTLFDYLERGDNAGVFSQRVSDRVPRVAPEAIEQARMLLLTRY